MSPLDDALEFFEEGYGCSQAVLGAYAPTLGLDFDQAMRLTAPFAAPLCSDLCGALSGALMVLGLAGHLGLCHRRGARLRVPLSTSSTSGSA